MPVATGSAQALGSWPSCRDVLGASLRLFAALLSPLRGRLFFFFFWQEDRGRLPEDGVAVPA